MIGKLIVLLLSLLVAHYIRLRIVWDVGKSVLNHAPGKCHIVPGIETGSEDLILLDKGIVLITSGHRDPDKRHNSCYENVKGFIGLYDMNKPKSPVTAVPIIGDIDTDNLTPHGITYFGPDRNGEYTIMFVNHYEDHDAVEICSFNLKDRQLLHLRTVRYAGFGYINDVVATGTFSFYVTNMQYYHNKWGIMMCEWLLLKWGQLLYHDGTDTRVVSEGYLSPNGLNISPDEKYVYMAEAIGKAVHIFRRNEDNSVTLHEKIDLPTLPDNIEVDLNNGDLWIGCHPVTWMIGRNTADTSQVAPSQVLRLQVTDGHVTSIQEVYSDDGHRLWGSSAAIKYKNGLLIGTVTHKLGYCTLDNIYF